LAGTVAVDARGVVRAGADDEDLAVDEVALENGTRVPMEALVEGLVCRGEDGCCAADGVGSGAGVTAGGAALGGGASGVAWGPAAAAEKGAARTATAASGSERRRSKLALP
jgi:hypothetical protein